MNDIVKVWRARQNRTTPIADRKAYIDLICEVYSTLKLNKPKVTFVDTPDELTSAVSGKERSWESTIKFLNIMSNDEMNTNAPPDPNTTLLYPRLNLTQHAYTVRPFTYYKNHVVASEKKDPMIQLILRQRLECCALFEGKSEVVVLDFPTALRRDDAGLLHCADDYTILWGNRKDGSCYWRGQKVPNDWILETASVKAQDVLAAPNAEVRRAGCEILGWAKIIDQLHGAVIDTDVDEEVGQLVEVDIPDIGRERLLRVRCGTGRQFAIPVPPEMQTALQAQAWLWELDIHTYTKPEKIA